MTLAKDNAKFIELNDELDTFLWFEKHISQKLDPLISYDDETAAIYMNEMRFELEEELELHVAKMQRKQKIRDLFTVTK